MALDPGADAFCVVAFSAGFQASAVGAAIIECPFDLNTTERRDWLEGWVSETVDFLIGDASLTAAELVAR